MSEKKVERKVKTTVNVDRELWSFVKSEATLTSQRTKDIVEKALREYKEKREKE